MGGALHAATPGASTLWHSHMTLDCARCFSLQSWLLPGCLHESTALSPSINQRAATGRGSTHSGLCVSQNVSVNLFETTIRVLGGLQSAFLLSGGDRVFLLRAVDLALRMSVRRIQRCSILI